MPHSRWSAGGWPTVSDRASSWLLEPTHIGPSKLLEVLHRLTDLGNSIIIIEHNMDVIRNADWIIDLGPEGGDGGGRVIVEGSPEHVAKTPESYTGRYLAPLLGID